MERHQTNLQPDDIDSDSPLNELEPLAHASHNKQPQIAIVIDGKALDFALCPRLQHVFFFVATKSAAIICCRVSPKQKANIVELVRLMEPQSVTLAIGDGANDVGMIQAAHIGIGVSGKEGTQAVNASDYAIAQFRFLQRLLCVHGRWAYRRVTKLMCYMLYKNVTYVLTTFWFGFVNGFSGQPLIIDVAAQSFNVLYTSIPLILFAVFDQDVSSRSACKVPYLYALGQRNTLLRRRVFWPWILNGVWHSIVIFFLSVVTFYGTRWICSNVTCTNSSTSDPAGKMEGLDTFGLVVFTNLVIVVNLKLCLETFLITWPFVISVLYSIAVWFLFGNLIAMPRVGIFHAIGELPYLQTLPSFWALIILASSISLLRDSIWKITRRVAYPSTYHILQEREMLQLTTSPRQLFPQSSSESSKDSLENFLERSSSLSEKLIASPTMDLQLRARGFGASAEDDMEEKGKIIASKLLDVGHYYRQGKGEYTGYAFSEDENAGTDSEAASMSTSRLPRRHERSHIPRSVNRRSFKYILKSFRGAKNA